jgi:hypothetical protein
VNRQRVAACVVVLCSLAAPVLTGVTGAASGEAGAPAKTIPTLPPASSTSTAGATGTGIRLRAQASLPEFLPVVNGIVGATGDVAGELAALAEVPSGILSPDGAAIRQFSVDYYGVDEHFEATATFSSAATPDDAVVFYQATLSAAGFTPVADSGASEGAGSTRRLRFETPNSRLDDAIVDVAVTDREPTDIELTITDWIDADVLSAFTGWAAGFPTLPEAVPIEARISVMTGPGPSDLTLTLSTLFAYSGYTPERLAEAVRAALPDGGFSVAAGDDSGSGTTIALRHIVLREVTGEIGTSDSHPATLLLSGTVTL